MWQIIKFLNKRVNEMLCVRMKLMLWIGIFPKIKHDYSFRRKHSFNWGSAPPEAESFYSMAAVSEYPYLVRINTERIYGLGKDFNGELVEKPYRSGMIQANISTTGSHSILAEFDPLARYNWEAIWYLNEEKRYREIDMERLHPDKVLFSVHDGKSSSEGRRIYNHEYPLPGNVVEFTFRFRPFTRIYINGILMFVGFQWLMPKRASFIISSGVQGGHADDAVGGTFKVHGYRSRFV